MKGEVIQQQSNHLHTVFVSPQQRDSFRGREEPSGSADACISQRHTRYAQQVSDKLHRHDTSSRASKRITKKKEKEKNTEHNKKMGGGGSKAAGGVASVASKTVRRSLPKAGDAAPPHAGAATQHHRTSPSRSLLEPVFRDPDAPDEAAQHKFFRPVKPNDGTLAPVKPSKVWKNKGEGRTRHLILQPDSALCSLRVCVRVVSCRVLFSSASCNSSHPIPPNRVNRVRCRELK